MAGLKGKSGGVRSNAGRKPKDEEQKLLAILNEVIDTDKWKAILEKAYIRASEGDLGYAKLLMEYRFGKPIDNVALNTSGELTIKVVRD